MKTIMEIPDRPIFVSDFYWVNNVEMIIDEKNKIVKKMKKSKRFYYYTVCFRFLRLLYDNYLFYHGNYTNIYSTFLYLMIHRPINSSTKAIT